MVFNKFCCQLSEQCADALFKISFIFVLNLLDNKMCLRSSLDNKTWPQHWLDNKLCPLSLFAKNRIVILLNINLLERNVLVSGPSCEGNWPSGKRRCSSPDDLLVGSCGSWCLLLLRSLPGVQRNADCKELNTFKNWTTEKCELYNSVHLAYNSFQPKINEYMNKNSLSYQCLLFRRITFIGVNMSKIYSLIDLV